MEYIYIKDCVREQNLSINKKKEKLVNILKYNEIKLVFDKKVGS
jgi:hypothetical protein